MDVAPERHSRRVNHVVYKLVAETPQLQADLDRDQHEEHLKPPHKFDGKLESLDLARMLVYELSREEVGPKLEGQHSLTGMRWVWRIARLAESIVATYLVALAKRDLEIHPELSAIVPVRPEETDSRLGRIAQLAEMVERVTKAGQHAAAHNSTRTYW
jgi:hypothetical protein